MTRRADALRLKVAAVELQHLAVVGAIPGVIPYLAAARNGPGTARIRSTGDGSVLSYRAPGSATWGSPMSAAVDGEYLLCDGEDADKWLRITVDVSFLTSGPAEARVLLTRLYDVGVADDDVTAAEASAGDVATYTITLENTSTVTLSHLRIWLDPTTYWLEISDDGATWVTPASVAAALALPDLAAGATDTLHLRRTLPAGSPPEPSILNQIHLSFCGL